MNKESVAWGRLVYGAIALLAGVAGAYWGQPLIQNNQEAVSLIVNVYSILAGLLFAVITVLGNSASLVDGSWRAGVYSKKVIRRRLLRHRLLFKAYLITLVCIFFSMLFKEDCIKKYFEYGYLFLAVVATLMSFTLPSSLLKVQEEQLENEINRRKREAGIKESA